MHASNEFSYLRSTDLDPHVVVFTQPHIRHLVQNARLMLGIGYISVMLWHELNSSVFIMATGHLRWRVDR